MPANFAIKTIAKDLTDAACTRRFLSLQRSGQYSELRIVQQGTSKNKFAIKGYRWPDRKSRRRYKVGKTNPTPKNGITPNQIRFGQRGKSKIGWIADETPTRYYITYKDGPHTRHVWRKKTAVRFMKPTGKKNPCPKTAENPNDLAAAIALSKKFYQLEPRKISKINIGRMPRAVTFIGLCPRLDYISDKFDGKITHYYHHFKKAVRVYASPRRLPGGNTMLMIIGPFAMKAEGITG